MRIAPRWLTHSLAAVTAVALFTACSDSSPAAPSTTLDLAATSAAVDLGTCDSLSVPAGSQLAFHAYAQGAQIYHWDGASWLLDGPSATLYADAGGQGPVGTHYAGPTWQTTSGSTVVGMVSKRCPAPTPNAIPWLLLTAASSGGPGVFQGVTHVQRVNTVGGKAPAEAGSLNEIRAIPYTAEYFFYRAP